MIPESGAAAGQIFDFGAAAGYRDTKNAKTCFFCNKKTFVERLFNKKSSVILRYVVLFFESKTAGFQFFFRKCPPGRPPSSKNPCSS